MLTNKWSIWHSTKRELKNTIDTD